LKTRGERIIAAGGGSHVARKKAKKKVVKVLLTSFEAVSLGLSKEMFLCPAMAAKLAI
jgi:hypothetical protein